MCACLIESKTIERQWQDFFNRNLKKKKKKNENKALILNREKLKLVFPNSFDKINKWGKGSNYPVTSSWVQKDVDLWWQFLHATNSKLDPIEPAYDMTKFSLLALSVIRLNNVHKTNFFITMSAQSNLITRTLTASHEYRLFNQHSFYQIFTQMSTQSHHNATENKSHPIKKHKYDLLN